MTLQRRVSRLFPAHVKSRAPEDLEELITSKRRILSKRSKQEVKRREERSTLVTRLLALLRGASDAPHVNKNSILGFD